MVTGPNTQKSGTHPSELPVGDMVISKMVAKNSCKAHDERFKVVPEDRHPFLGTKATGEDARPLTTKEQEMVNSFLSIKMGALLHSYS